MQSSKNLQNTNLASVKEKIIIRRAEQRTEEQMRIVQRAIAASKGKPEVKSMQAKG